jgi:hypothetical protein
MFSSATYSLGCLRDIARCESKTKQPRGASHEIQVPVLAAVSQLIGGCVANAREPTDVLLLADF